MLRLMFIVVIVSLQSAAPAFAGVAGQAAKAIARKFTGEAVEAVAKKTAKRVASEVAEKSAKEVAEATARRTASAAARQFGHAVASAPRFADDLAKAGAKMTARNERRLMMMAPTLKESGQAAAVVSRLANGNADELIETLWKHREKLGAAAVVTGLLIHGDDVVEAGGEFVAKPVIDGTMEHVVAPVSRLFVSGVILTVLIGMVGLGAYLFGGEATDRVTAIVGQLLSLIGRQR